MVDWLAMGGYGFYVWSAYGLVLSVMAGNVIWSAYRKRKVFADIKRFLAKEPK